MACLITANAPVKEINSFTSFLDESGDWHRQLAPPDRGILSDLWYRGVSSQCEQAPRVYRKDFQERAKTAGTGNDVEDNILHLERHMLGQFRNAGAAFLSGRSLTELYFTAQHFGMPTRLLDWSTNPLAALFFACEKDEEKDGFVYAMDAGLVIPSHAQKPNGKPLYRVVMSMRNEFVTHAVGVSFWNDAKPAFRPYILPVRPDFIPGRIGQQNSCFTLHMRKADNVNNPTLTIFKIPRRIKGDVKQQLERVNINQFTAYYDLDHLSAEIKRSWRL